MTTVPTRYWHALPDGRVQCDVCPRACKLRDGQRGLCFVRAREGDGVVLTTYGRSSGFCVDPIEKKPLNHFLPGSSVLSFGTAGCNLACRFCQNWDISKSKEVDTLADAAAPDDLAAAAQRLGCRSVAFTYNDPTIFMEYAIDVADACRAAGISSVAVTAGYISPEPRREMYAHMDAANVDLKAFTEDFYRHVCGAHLADVLDTLEYLVHDTDVWVEITTLLIPGRNDDPEEIDAMTRWIVDHLGPDVPLHFTAFHPDFKMMDVDPTPPATLTARPRDRVPQRRALRVHRQRARHQRGQHEVHGLRHVAHRARLVPARPLPPHGRRSLPVVRYRASGPLRRAGRHVGRAPPPGSDRRRVTGEATRVREPAVAGRFYPGRTRALADTVDGLLAAAPIAAATGGTAPVPKAIVVPHAGYDFSGPIAASGYARLAPARATVRRVVLLGPAHRVALDGLAAPRARPLAHAAR